MKFNFTNLTKGQTKSNTGKPTIHVSKGILTQATKDLRQAQIIVHGLAEDTYRGDVHFSVGDKKYSLYKGDTHCVWFTHQKTAEQQEAFGVLFNMLAEKVDQKVEVTK